jgi:hypothetical protein
MRIRIHFGQALDRTNTGQVVRIQRHFQVLTCLGYYSHDPEGMARVWNVGRGCIGQESGKPLIEFAARLTRLFLCMFEGLHCGGCGTLLITHGSRLLYVGKVEAEVLGDPSAAVRIGFKEKCCLSPFESLFRALPRLSTMLPIVSVSVQKHP